MKIMSNLFKGALFLSSPLFFSSTGLAKHAPHYQGGFDAAIANKERLIEMLQRSGEIPSYSSEVEAELILNNYLRKRQLNSATVIENNIVPSYGLQGYSKDKENGRRPSKLKKGRKGKSKNKGHCSVPARRNKVDCIELETYTGEVSSPKILSILIEFPDFPHNAVESWETDMYYEDYSPAHYNSLIFSPDGASGPEGQSIVSMRQYYEQQSGGSYLVDGKVAGWYMASQPAAFYGMNNEYGNDSNPRALVQEALLAVAADPSIDLSEFDQEDRYDLDGDGIYWEPDGLVDHIQIFHSSVGEEAGGGQLGEDAIWSHFWTLSDIFTLPGTVTEVPYWGGELAAYAYTIHPIDSAPGVISHEFGHNLGLPDEYDTSSSGRGEPVSFWSIMSSGSWAGDVPGTEPTGFSAWSKEFLQTNHGGNWLSGDTVAIEDLTEKGVKFLIDQAASKGTNHDAVRIDLPPKKNIITVPTSGEFAYFSGTGNDLTNSMTTSIDLTNASSASLTFKAWFDIEADWDYAYVLVNGEPIEGNITTDVDPYGQNFGNGITGSSEGWVDAKFDLSLFVGETIDLTFHYWTDSYVANSGLYVDDIQVADENGVVFSDNADGELLFALDGYTQDYGFTLTPHYYLVEWRTYQGVDKGLEHVRSYGAYLPFNEGLVIWYVDTSYGENWVGVHPGYGFLGVVDADQRLNYWNDGNVASTRFQVHDAAFSLDPSAPVDIEINSLGLSLQDHEISPISLFSDDRSYFSEEIPDAGKILVNYGLQIAVIGQSPDKTVAKILVRKIPSID